jgi:hypothetical protein
MPLGDKLQVCVAFGFRLAIIPFSVLHLLRVADLVHSADPPLESTDALIMQQAMLFCSILTSTIPNMKGFMASFSMAMGVKLFESDVRTFPSRESYALQTIGGRSIIRSTLNCGHGGEERAVMRGANIALMEDPAVEIGRMDSESQGNVDRNSSVISQRGSQDWIIRKTDSYGIPSIP